ncbi:MAG: aminodeoxychorismate synthase component I [Lysobacterales bacterium]
MPSVPLPLAVDLPAVDLLELHRAEPGFFPCLLESAAQGGRARYDLLLAAPAGGFALGADGVLRDLEGRTLPGGFLDHLDRACAEARTPVRSDGPAFGGGWALLLGYELAAEIEPSVPRLAAPGGLPIALALRCRAAILRDRETGQAQAVVEADHPQAAALIERLQRAWSAAADSQGRTGEAPAARALPGLPAHRIDEADGTQFEGGVRRILDYLSAGDVFQVNLSRPWRVSFDAAPAPADLYERLRAANPAPFAGLLAWQDWAVLSSSPERLLSLRSGLAETRPIAGTRPRQPGDALDDARRRAELIGHPKERAEHIMLIDLERNDLGRVCVPGTVEVDELMGLESYAHVHHIVSNVRGRLRPEVGPGQAIAAVFPGGTITGCPKVRCMQIIAELEGEGRGPYTGALGYLDRSGDLDLNILIRSLWLRGAQAGFRAGAGIVVDSEPAAELAETRAKARGVLRAFDEHAPRDVLPASEGKASTGSRDASAGSVVHPVVESADAPPAALSTAGTMDIASHRPQPESAPLNAGRRA